MKIAKNGIRHTKMTFIGGKESFSVCQSVHSKFLVYGNFERVFENDKTGSMLGYWYSVLGELKFT